MNENNILKDDTIFNFLKHIENLPKWKITEVSKLINRKKRELFPDRKYKLLGEQSKKISKENFEKILSFEKKEKIKLAYKLMYYMGLRVSEIVLIKKEDFINWNLTIHNIKANRKETRLVPLRLRKKIQNYYLKNFRKIELHNDFLFYSDSPTINKDHLNKDWLRNHFRELTKLAGINKVYTQSKDGRNLYILSSHSLRHSFGNRFYEISNSDIEKTRIALRHRRITDTQNYIQGDLSEVNNIMLNL